MSIEYTIDIQLTELGYADILQPRETSVRETPCRSTSRAQRHLVRDKEAGAAKQTSDIKETTAASTSPRSETCTPQNPAQDEQTTLDVSESTQTDPAAGPEAADLPQLITDQADNREEHVGDTGQEDSAEMQGVEDDSDDSDVSVVYEEEEEEEDDDDEEEEEGLNNESSHSGDYRCSVCDLQLPSKFKLQDHMNLHTGARPYCCAECGKRFCQIYNYRVHLRTHAQTKAEPLHCRVCLMAFESEEGLKFHLSRTHLENEFYECDLCKRIFTSLKACEYHVQLHKCRLDLMCDTCGRIFSSPKSLARHRKWTCYSSFKCTDCTKTFPKKNALLKHSFSHLGLLPYTCIRCRCHFRLARLYRKHKCEPQRIHCVACLREFLSQEDFQRHKKDTGCWGNQEPKGDEIRCLECGQRFDTCEELKKHAGAHQRVLKCAECGKGFRSALLLMSHMGGHAGNSPCLCQSCGLGFPHQQNYDSHLKTCGQTPQPTRAPRKRQAPKSSSSEATKVNAKAESSNPANTAAIPAAAINSPAAAINSPAAAINSPAAAINSPTAAVNSPAAAVNSPAAVINNPAAAINNPAAVINNPAAAVNNSAAPVEDSSSPGLVSEGASTSWKLTLNRQPPPGVKLVVFLPVCTAQTDGLTRPSEISPTLQVPAMQGQPNEAFLPDSYQLENILGKHANLRALLNCPLNLTTGTEQNPELQAPLDLSKKYNSSKSDLNIPPIKSESAEVEITGAANGNERRESENGFSKAIAQTHPGETDSHNEVKHFKVDPMDLSSFNVNTTSSGLTIDIKKEPQSPGPGSDLQSSAVMCQLTQEEIKMEVDISHPHDAEK